MNISDVLKNQLGKPSHIVKVEDKANGFRLKKQSGLMRYAYSLNDLLKEYDTIENFIAHLQDQGFEETTFLFQRTYGGFEKTTYHTVKEITENLHQNTNPAMNSATPTPMNQSPNFLAGSNQVDQNIQFLGALVQSERAGDYKQRVNELEEDTKDYRSKIRRLEEENHLLKLKVDTSEERANLKIQQELLNKKGILESEGFQKLAEGLGGLIPHIPAFLNKGGAPAQLGSPAENISPVKSKTIELLKDASDDDVSFVAYVLQNMNKRLVEVLTNHIQNQ